MTIYARLNQDSKKLSHEPANMEVDIPNRIVPGHEMAWRVFLTQEPPEMDNLATDLLATHRF
ncbi:MAG: hypothetical protein ACYCQJ_12090 [Nitrososphaerales archaeon]